LGDYDLAREAALGAGIGAAFDIGTLGVGELLSPYIKGAVRPVVDALGRYVARPAERYVSTPLKNAAKRVLESEIIKGAIEQANRAGVRLSEAVEPIVRPAATVIGEVGNATAKALSSPTGVALTTMRLGAA
jgi:hypothetical protein